MPGHKRIHVWHINAVSFICRLLVSLFLFVLDYFDVPITTLPILEDRLNTAQRLVIKYSDIQTSANTIEKTTLSNIKEIMYEKRIRVTDFTATGISLTDRHSKSCTLGKQLDDLDTSNINVTVANSVNIEKALRDINSRRCVLVLLGKEDKDIPYETYNCMSCITTECTFMHSLERLLLRLLLSFFRCLFLNLYYDIQINNTSGELTNLNKS